MGRKLLWIPILLFVSYSSFAAKDTVQVADFSFSPANLNINLGDTVVFSWVSGVHTTTSVNQSMSNAWDASMTSANPVFELVIDSAGSFVYSCNFHPGMNGTIDVQDTTSTPANQSHIIKAGTAGSFSFSPDSLTINIGDTVSFQWVSGSHTTTSDNQSMSNAWDANLTSTDTVFELVLDSSGVYYYHCTPHASMGMRGVVTVLDSSGNVPDVFVEKVDDKPDFILSPNPFSNRFSVVCSVPVDQVVIWDVLGNQCHAWSGVPSRQKGIDLSELPSGIYFAKFYSGNNELAVKKIIKQ